MTAVARLMITYFAGTTFLRVVTALGLSAVGGGAAALLYLPPLLGGSGMPSSLSLGAETFLAVLPVFGTLAIVFGASLMPALFARLAASHYVYVLPYGRAKLLLSVFATIVLIATISSATSTVYYVGTPMPLDLVFLRSFVVTALTYSLLYIVLWLTGRSRTSMGLIVGVVVIVATLVLPLRFVAIPSTSLYGPAVACALLWSVFALGFLFAPRLKGTVGQARQALALRAGVATYEGGREIDFVLGTANPWSLALGQIAPILLGTYFLGGFVTAIAPSASTPWLSFLTILSAISGAIASFAATRSRALWLRAHWTRAELFVRVEGAFWRYNCYTLGVLLLMLVALGDYYALPTRTLAFGLGLLALGTTLSTYLGLMVTATLGWGQAVLAAATMLSLMKAAAYVTASATPTLELVALGAALGAAALLFRRLAERRWLKLDWMLCRAEPGVRAAT